MTLRNTQLYPASFRGVPFLMEIAEETEGRKLAIHEYPNNNTRFVEDLGALPSSFILSGVISGPNYLNNRDNLKAALRTPGIGELVHPFLGTIQVTPQPYTVTELITDLNVARFSMPFLVSSAPEQPQISGNNKSFIRNLQKQIIDLARIDIIDSFEVTRNLRNNYNDAVALLTTVNSVFEDVLRIYTSDPISNSDLNRELIRFSNNINSLPASPGITADSITDLFTLANDVAETPEDGVNLYSLFFRFGADDIPFSLTTAEKIERQKNRDILNSAINVDALVFSYLNAVQIEYETDEQLLETQQLLEDQAKYILSDNSDDALSGETLQRIKQIRVQVNKFFKQELLLVSKITTIKIQQPTSLLSLTYSLYGDLDNYVKLLQLNNILNPSFVQGDVRILSSDN